MSALPLLLCIDVEPDHFFISRDQLPWRGYERAVAWLEAVRHDLAQVAGPTQFTWVFRMDRQVSEVYGQPDWVLRRYPAELETILRAGDDIGLHAHAYRWDGAVGAWIVDHGNQTWVEECLRTSFDAFAAAVGRPCRTFRFGDRWMNQDTVQWLDREGVHFDLTIEPGQPPLPSYHPGERFTGSLPDYTAVPRAPYHPALDDYRRADVGATTRLWMIPMTTATASPRWARRVYYRLFTPWRRGVWVAMLSHEPLLFRRIITAALADPALTHLGVPVRSDVFASPRLLRRVEANVAFLRDCQARRPFVWTVAEGVARSRCAP